MNQINEKLQKSIQISHNRLNHRYKSKKIIHKSNNSRLSRQTRYENSSPLPQPPQINYENRTRERNMSS